MTALQKVILKKQDNPYKEFSAFGILPRKKFNAKNRILYPYIFHYIFFKSSLGIKERRLKRKFQNKTQMRKLRNKQTVNTIKYN